MSQRLISTSCRKQFNTIIRNCAKSNHYSTSVYFNERLTSPSIRQTNKIPYTNSLHTTSILYQKEENKEETPKEETYADVVKRKEEETGKELDEWTNANSTWDGRVLAEEFKEGEEIPYAQLPPLDDGSGKVLAPPHVHEIADEMLKLSMFEMFQLITMMGKYYGIDMSQASAAGPAGGAAEAEEEVKVEEKTLFELKLTGFDAKSKIKVIKEIRSITALGLKEAKELVEGSPKVVKKDIKMEEAEELKAKIEAVGGTVEIE